MQRPRQSGQRIGHRMNDVLAQRRDVLFRQRLCSRCFDPFFAARQASPENVVFATRVDPDDRPHAVIVRQEVHPRRPDDIQDREVVCAVQRLDLPLSWFPKSRQNGPGLRHGTRQDFADRTLGRLLAQGGPAIGDKLFALKHESPPLCAFYASLP